MDDDTTSFGSLSRSIEHFSGEFAKAKEEQATGEMLIASAEYELEQLKKLLADARLDAPRAPVAQDEKPAAFAEKLRNPEKWDDPDWPTVLGLCA